MQRDTKKSMSIPKAALPLLLICGLVLGGCGKDDAPPQRPKPEVSFFTVEPQALDLTTELPGRTSVYQVAEIRPQINGVVQQVAFTEGSDVKEGDLLFQIDPVLYQANYDSARASLTKAEVYLPSIQARANRYRELLKTNAVSKQDYDDTVSALAQARADLAYCRANLKQAKTNLDYTRITAPFSGRIGKTDARIGTLVTAYQAVSLATLQQLDPVYVDVTQSSADFLRLRKHFESGALRENEAIARKVTLLLEDGTAYPHTGELRFQDATVNPSTGSFFIRIAIPNPDLLLYPGMYVRAVLQEGQAPEAILVPQQAVRRNYKGDPYVFIVTAENTIQETPVVLDRTIGSNWFVTSGVKKGDRLVMEGALNIADKSEVRAVPFVEKKQEGKADSQPQPDEAGNKDK